MEENESEQKQEKKIAKNMKIIVISFFFFVIGLVNFLIMHYAKYEAHAGGFLLIYLVVLGELSITAGVGLLSLKRWGFYLAVTMAVLQAAVSFFTLYSSFLTIGSLNPNVTVLAINLGLLGWVAASIIAAIYLAIRRSEFH